MVTLTLTLPLGCRHIVEAIRRVEAGFDPVDLAVRTKVFAASTGYQRWRASKLLPIVGCLIDMFSATVVIVPLLVPLGAAYGVHPVCDRDCTEPA